MDGWMKQSAAVLEPRVQPDAHRTHWRPELARPGSLLDKGACGPLHVPNLALTHSGFSFSCPPAQLGSRPKRHGLVPRPPLVAASGLVPRPRPLP